MKNLLIPAVLLLAIASLSAESTRQREVVSGAIWRDTDGNAINAHGGGILFHEGVYYWYGELKEGRTYLPQVNKRWGGTRVIAGGVSCYSSTDLVTWKNEGVVLPAVADDPDHDLACENVIERPKVIFNRLTGKFVMWFHQDSPDYQAARSGVAVCDTPNGRFKYLGAIRPNAGVRPLNATDADLEATEGNLFARDFKDGQMARDMTLFVDDDGKAYHLYSSEANKTLHISQLSDDYLSHSGRFVRSFIGRSMEAPAIFKRGGKYYLFASGTTGWDPNPARSSVADNIFGPWTELGNPCRGEGAEITFSGQSTFVLPVAGKSDLFIAMFDQWKKWDLADSRYIWLPVEFDEADRPILRWHERWTLPK